MEKRNANDQSGYWQGLSINADGTRVAVGAWQNDGGGNDAGHVPNLRVFGRLLVSEVMDIDGGGANYNFGYSLSLDSDGSHIVIGGPNKGDRSGRKFINIHLDLGPKLVAISIIIHSMMVLEHQLILIQMAIE